MKKNHANMIDLKGQRFGNLTVVERIGTTEGKARYAVWLCKCDCGNKAKKTINLLKYTKIIACRSCVKNKIIKHGAMSNKDKIEKTSSHRLYHVWTQMKSRCSRKDHATYLNYGKRGIKVCPEWQNDFVAFRNWAMNNGYENGLTIDRLNPDLNYDPSNCEWVTKSENSRRVARPRFRILEQQKASKDLQENFVIGQLSLAA